MKKTILVFLFLVFCYLGYGQTCTLNVSLSPSSNDICIGSTVVITAAASAGTGPYTFIWSTGETSAAISINKGGTYSVIVTDQTTGCQSVKKSITINNAVTPAPPTVKSVIICKSGPATLSATAPGGLYQWYDANGNFLASGATYTAPNVTSNSTFYVQTTVNGCTSVKTAAPVIIAGKPIVTSNAACAGTPATLVASGADSYVWYDAATGGKVLSTDATLVTGPLSKSTTFYLVATTGSCVSARIPEIASVNTPPQTPVAAGLTICTGSTALLHASVTDGGVLQWFSSLSSGLPLISSADFTTPLLTTATTYYVQNSLNGCVSKRVPVKVTIAANSAIPVDQTLTTCYNTSIQLTAASNPSGNYKWYDAATGGNLLSTGNIFTTPALKNNTTYFVQNINNTCAAGRAAITVIVSPAVQPPSVVAPIICSGSVTTLTASSPGGVYHWYDAATGGNLLATGASFVTPTLVATTTFYVQATVSGCMSARTAVTVPVIPAVAAPVVNSATICAGNSATLTAAGVNGDYSWYDAATGGNLVSSAQAFVTPALNSTTIYYVQVTTPSGCSSARVPATVTVNQIPSTPVVTNPAAVCPGSQVTLTATSSSGTLRWYDAAAGGTLLATGNNFTTDPLYRDNTFYVESTNASCVSERTPVTVTVISLKNPAFQYPSATVCTSAANLTPVVYQPGTFTASPAGLVFTDNKTGEINVAASNPGKYTISFAGDGTCPNPGSISINIVTNPDAQFSYNTPVCTGGKTLYPVFPSGSTAGVFTASPSGLLFTNKTTGGIDLINSKPGNYTITNTIAANGTCPAKKATFTLVIEDPISINAGPDQTVKTGSLVHLQGSIIGSTAKWSGGGGSFSNTNQPDAVYTPAAGETSAQLIFTSGTSGPCGPKADTVVVSLAPTPAAPTAFGKSICAGGSATLSATLPGGSYQWYDAASGGNLLASGPNFTTPALSQTTVYYVQTTVNGITSSRAAITVNVSTIPVTPTVTPPPSICGSGSVSLTATGSAGTYEWYDAETGGNLLSTANTFITPILTQSTSCYVQSLSGSCNSTRATVNITVNPTPLITSPSSGIVCSGDAQSYAITSNIAGATFLWSRSATPGISNAALVNQTTSLINEALINTGTTPVNVTYQIVPLNASCSGNTFSYVVTVYPKLTVKSTNKATFCSGSPGVYAFLLSDPSATFTWRRDAVAGISNAAVTGQSSGNVQEVLFNTTNAPVNTVYTFTYGNYSCAGNTFDVVVTVNPEVNIISDPAGIACDATPQNYVITSNVPSATFMWSRAAVPGISNAAINNQVTASITESLNNTTNAPVKATYLITPLANGCPGQSFTYSVTVSPIPSIPAITGNSPVCTGNAIQLSTPAIVGATYLWTGPNGFNSPSQSPSIPNASAANAGIYNLSIIENGCISPAASYTVKIDELPKADAGPDQTVCTSTTNVQLAGNVSGGTTTGFWSTNGAGKFSPAANQLNAIYTPSLQDKTAGSVVLTLSSTSKDDCSISTSAMTIKFGKLPAVDAGPDQTVCAQDPGIKLSGKLLISGGGLWSTSGTGTFSPNENTINASYIPSAEDVKKGSVKLVLLATSADACYFPADTMTVNLMPPPVVNAGGIRYVLKGHTITLTPTVNQENVTYKWSPDVDISDVNIQNPIVTGDQDITYKLTVTNALGCITADETVIKVSPALSAPNVFTPNDDSKNDTWNIEGLVAYENATVDVFDRYGQKVFHSLGYSVAWNGRLNGNGRPLPTGTYYFIIDTKVNNLILKGPVTIMR